MIIYRMSQIKFFQADKIKNIWEYWVWHRIPPKSFHSTLISNNGISAVKCCVGFKKCCHNVSRSALIEISLPILLPINKFKNCHFLTIYWHFLPFLKTENSKISPVLADKVNFFQKYSPVLVKFAKTGRKWHFFQKNDRVLLTLAIKFYFSAVSLTL